MVAPDPVFDTYFQVPTSVCRLQDGTAVRNPRALPAGTPVTLTRGDGVCLNARWDGNLLRVNHQVLAAETQQQQQHSAALGKCSTP